VEIFTFQQNGENDFMNVSHLIMSSNPRKLIP